MQPFVLVVAAVVVLLIVVLAVVVATSGGGDSQAVEQLRDAEANFPYDMADGRVVGSPDAPLKLVQFEDFQCPFCLRYTAEDEPTLVEEYVKTGKLQIEYKNRPILGSESTRAALAGQCAAEEDKFWEYHNRLFLTQAEAGQLSNEQIDAGRFSDGRLVSYAGDLGLDTAAFEACMNSADTLAVVQADEREAVSYGINGTPGFLINGQPVGGTPSSLEAWRSVLDDLYNQVLSPTPTATATASTTPTGTATPSSTATGTSTATATASP